MKICQYVVITTATDYHIFFMIDYESNMINDSFAELYAIKRYTTLWNASHKGAKTSLDNVNLRNLSHYFSYLKSCPS